MLNGPVCRKRNSQDISRVILEAKTFIKHKDPEMWRKLINTADLFGSFPRSTSVNASSDITLSSVTIAVVVPEFLLIVKTLLFVCSLFGMTNLYPYQILLEMSGAKLLWVDALIETNFVTAIIWICIKDLVLRIYFRSIVKQVKRYKTCQLPGPLSHAGR